jgi:hypothetical protein
LENIVRIGKEPAAPETNLKQADPYLGVVVVSLDRVIT